MRFALYLVSVGCAGLLATLPAAASHLVTGNGFGFAVVQPETGTVSKFYAHPYSFARPDSQNPLSEGVETANFIQELEWRGESAQANSSEYEEDSQVIRTSRSDGEGVFFMPFGLSRSALVISWEPGTTEAHSGGWTVEWSRPVKSQRVVRMFGNDLRLMKFEGIEETLLLIPLGQKRVGRGQPQQVLSTSLAWALVSLENNSELETAAKQFFRWRAGLGPRALAKREIAEMERWRVKPAVHFTGENERHLWRQSEVMLRMAQSREPNRPGRYGNGLIVACLPDGVYFTPWVRDMA
jgi:hypothetical protein